MTDKQVTIKASYLDPRYARDLVELPLYFKDSSGRKVRLDIEIPLSLFDGWESGDHIRRIIIELPSQGEVDLTYNELPELPDEWKVEWQEWKTTVESA